MRRLLVLGALAAGCATGTGEEATGFVEATLLPAGTASGGVRFESALLSLEEIEFLAAEEERDEPADDGHGHAHLTAALRALADPVIDGTSIDLLGAEQPLGSAEVAVATYEAALLELGAATMGEAAGCAIFATGNAAVGGELPVVLCVPAPVAVEVPLGIEVGLGDTTQLRFVFSLNRLLQGVDVLPLAPDPDGTIRIDAATNEAALELVLENLPGVITVAG
ncbi:hypothetical protein [Vulgatibacter sp.]|uniref:hypothetical protein n=1 Tax=Vulgatibacter sp. TaxID=1971226 RepID=UPI0035683F63